MKTLPQFIWLEVSEISQSHLRSITFYEWKRGSSAAAVTRNIASVFGEGRVTERTVGRWFTRFDAGETDFEDEDRSGRPSTIYEDALLRCIKENPEASTRELPAVLGCHYSTINRHLNILGYHRVLTRWIPHRLTDSQRQCRVSISFLTPSRPSSGPKESAISPFVGLIMIRPFSIWLLVSSALLVAGLPIVDNRIEDVSDDLSKVDGLTRMAFKKAMSDPENTKRRLQALKATIQPPTQGLDELRQQFKGFKPSDDLARKNQGIQEMNAAAGVAPYLYQGDVLLTDDQLSCLESEAQASQQEGSRKKRQAMIPMQKWAQNTVYYYFDANVSTPIRQAVKVGLAYLQQNTCVTFRYNSTAPNRIRIINGGGCWSYIGRIGGEQEMSLGNGCDLAGIAAHEFEHALGIYHEQSRYDRDTYLTVDTTYVDPSQVHNFDKLTTNNSKNFMAYDYGSVMQYSASAFSTNGEVSMYTKKPIYQYTIGSYIIAFSDLKTINLYYACTPTCTTEQNAIKCTNQGIKNPRNCAKCVCPRGYSGATCNTLPTGGKSIAAPTTTAWRNITMTVGNKTDSVNVRTDYTILTYWFTVPTGKKIQMQVLSIYNSQCQWGCPFAGIEIKNGTAPQLVDPRICCSAQMSTIFTSTRNPTVVNVYNNYYYSQFTLRYRVVNA